MTETPLLDPRDEPNAASDKRALLSAIREATAAGDEEGLRLLLEPLHAADTADLLEQMSRAERRAVLGMWSGEIDGEILSEIDEGIREEVIDSLSPEVLAEAVRELDTDDVVDILEDLEEPQQNLILEALDGADRVAVERALSYPEYSAGRLMQREVVAVPLHWNVGQTIDHLRNASQLPDQFYHVILVDPRMKPQGYVTLGRLLASKREVALEAISEDSFRTVAATETEAEVAYIFNHYHLISCPVIDEHGRLVGVVTIDDAMNVLDDEHGEDMLRLAHVDDEASLSDGVGATLRGRLPWLGINLCTASISACVIWLFAGTINQVVALAALMPIVASMGGIAGTQSLTVAVRALATRDLTSANAKRFVGREAAVGMINGLAFALVLGAIVHIGFDWPELAWVIGIAMIVNLLVAALAGVLVPLTLNRLKLDPALASGTFVMTMTDVIGFLAFLGLATLLLF